jgi:hypothetical protein
VARIARKMKGVARRAWIHKKLSGQESKEESSGQENEEEESSGMENEGEKNSGQEREEEETSGQKSNDGWPVCGGPLRGKVISCPFLCYKY